MALGHSAHAHNSPAHDACLALTPVEAATATAVQDGLWSAPATWGGTLPKDGDRVHIPEGLLVVRDTETARLKWLRIDGKCEAATETDSHLLVETVTIGSDGAYRAGKPGVPFKAGVTAQTTIIGELEETDWQQLGLGILGCGDFDAWGEEKTPWLHVAKHPRKGDATITLESVPVNWRVGDELVIAGVRPPNFRLTSTQREQPDPDPLFREQHEKRTIAKIEGAVVTLSAPLAYDLHHQLKDGHTVAVGNLTRNVVFNSESREVAKRGHIMLMACHHVKRQIGYARFDGLGRTHTEFHVTDPQLDALLGTPIPETIINPRGRYSLHFHLNGFTDAHEVVGCAFTDGLKWGVVNHGSSVEIKDNVSHDVDGSLYATENGTEQGSIVGNLGIYSRGFGKLNESPLRSLGQGGDDNFFTANKALRDKRLRIAPLGDDWGFAGYGVWLQGSLVKCEGNELYGCMDAGIGNRTEAVGAVSIPLERIEDEALREKLRVDHRGDPRTNAPVNEVPYSIGPNFVAGAFYISAAYGNNPPGWDFPSTIKGVVGLNTAQGFKHYPPIDFQVLDACDAWNHPDFPGTKANHYYSGVGNLKIWDCTATGAESGFSSPRNGVNTIGGPRMRINCLANISIESATERGNKTILKLADSQMGPIDPATAAKARMKLANAYNIGLQFDSNADELRYVEWHRPGLPILQLWSNPAFAPVSAVAMPGLIGVASVLRAPLPDPDPDPTPDPDPIPDPEPTELETLRAEVARLRAIIDQVKELVN